MPPCTHCEYTRCPKCGHDCGQAPPLPKVFRIKADDCDRWYKGECSLGPVFTDDESEAELFSTIIECNRKMRHEDVTGCFIERVESSSQGIVDDSISSARVVYINADRPDLDRNELQQADALMSIFNLRRVSP